MAPGIGERERGFMKNKIKYSDEPIGDVEIIPDFLPPPEELVFKEETVKITISLTKQSIDFFKKQARHHKTPYQKLIRRLLDEYVKRQTFR